MLSHRCASLSATSAAGGHGMLCVAGAAVLLLLLLLWAGHGLSSCTGCCVHTGTLQCAAMCAVKVLAGAGQVYGVFIVGGVCIIGLCAQYNKPSVKPQSRLLLAPDRCAASLDGSCDLLTVI